MFMTEFSRLTMLTTTSLSAAFARALSSLSLLLLSRP